MGTGLLLLMLSANATNGSVSVPFSMGTVLLDTATDFTDSHGSFCDLFLFPSRAQLSGEADRRPVLPRRQRHRQRRRPSSRRFFGLLPDRLSTRRDNLQRGKPPAGISQA